MRTALLGVAALALSAAPAWRAQTRVEPFLPVGVWYGGAAGGASMASPDSARAREGRRRDLQTIRSLGFNAVATRVDWASVEPERAGYRFDALDEMLTLAGEAGLKVIVQVDADNAPAWLAGRYPDASLVNDRGTAIASGSPRFCLDHAGVRQDTVAFIGAAAARAATHRSFYGIDVWSESHPGTRTAAEPTGEFCYCVNTVRRYRDWLKLRYGTLEAFNAAGHRRAASWDEVSAPRADTTRADAIEWRTFIAGKLRDDLKLKADAAGPRGPRPVSGHADSSSVLVGRPSGFGPPDDWWMATAVDQYGTTIHPKPADAPPWSPSRLSVVLDGMRSAARDRGWWVSEVQGGPAAIAPRPAALVTGPDLRLWGWAALSRGATAVIYDASDGERARAAGAFADVVSRNPALFTVVKPRRSRVAILYNQLSYLAGARSTSEGTLISDGMLGAYRALFDANIQVDFLHPDEVAAGLASRYAAVILTSPVMLAGPVGPLLKGYVQEGGTLISEARPGSGLDEVFGAREQAARSAEVLESRYGKGRAILIGTSAMAAFERDPDARRANGELLRRLVASAGIVADVRIDGAPGTVEARFLESSDALLLVAVNHAETPQRVTLRFGRDVPEAIWQNMETGSAVNFVATADGPVYTHTFEARDAMVLVIRKKLR